MAQKLVAIWRLRDWRAVCASPNLQSWRVGCAELSPTCQSDPRISDIPEQQLLTCAPVGGGKPLPFLDVSRWDQAYFIGFPVNAICLVVCQRTKDVCLCE